MMTRKNSAVAGLAALGVLALTPAPSAHAEDWTLPGSGCYAALGSISASSSGIVAQGGTAVVSCPLTKVVSKEVGSAWARIKRSQDTYYQNCSIIATSSSGGSYEANFTAQSYTTNFQSVSLLPVADTSIGYLEIQCVLSSGDKLVGVRFQQN